MEEIKIGKWRGAWQDKTAQLSTGIATLGNPTPPFSKPHKSNFLIFQLCLQQNIWYTCKLWREIAIAFIYLFVDISNF